MLKIVYWAGVTHLAMAMANPKVRAQGDEIRRQLPMELGKPAWLACITAGILAWPVTLPFGALINYLNTEAALAAMEKDLTDNN